jgi:hypothetical protein
MAQVDAYIADVDPRPDDQLLHLLLRLPAEAARWAGAFHPRELKQGRCVGTAPFAGYAPRGRAHETEVASHYAEVGVAAVCCRSAGPCGVQLFYNHFAAQQRGATTSVACKRIVSVMAPKQGTVAMTWKESDLSQSPLQVMTLAIHDSPNAKLHSELAAFEAGAAAGNGPRTLDEANSMVQTCRRLGLGPKTTSQS